MLQVGGQVRLAVGICDFRLRVQGDLDRSKRRPRDADAQVQRALDSGATACLRETVALDERAAKGSANPLLHVGRNGAASRKRELHTTPDHRLELPEDKEIEQWGVPVLDDRSLLHAKRDLEQKTCNRPTFLELHLGALLDRFPHLRDARHERGLELLEPSCGVATLWTRQEGLCIGVAHGVAHAEKVHLRCHLQDVSQRQVRDVSFRALVQEHAELLGASTAHGEQLRMPHDDAFGLVGGAAGVHQHSYRIRVRGCRLHRLGAAHLDDFVERINLHRRRA
mmetsp:Transcript_47128/g.131508  ORF Transcript_47128/g.131508 Transcript_47128/m.131508 type:complete len:281 (-) Transcript_47128:903-1745(-)